MATSIITESSTSWVDVSFFNKDGTPATPDSVAYSLQCLATGKVLESNVPVTPASSSVEIALTPEDNKIQDENNSYEDKLLTVVATFGIDDQMTDDFIYRVRNLRGFPS
jgi:hypothetical protein